MKIDFQEITNDEDWELLARDFLAQSGFVIEVGPGRGADKGKDLLISEQLRGKMYTRKFTWLVSCKHFAVSGRSVGQDEEKNILERVKQHNADGFFGFYSTVASSSLIDRLRELVDNNSLAAYEIFDRQKIQAKLLDSGLASITLRYLPNSYEKFRPIQMILAEYEPLHCEICDQDVLKASVTKPFAAIVVTALPAENNHEGKHPYRSFEKIFIVCKGACDEVLRTRLYRQGFITQWEDLEDLCNPLIFLKNIMSYMNILYMERYVISKEAHQSMKRIYIAVAQRVLREVTEKDRERFKSLIPLDDL